jgi:hypothetical protein
VGGLDVTCWSGGSSGSLSGDLPSSVVARPVVSCCAWLCRGARTGTHHAKYAILIFGRELQWRKAQFGEAAVGFDGIEDPAYIRRGRYACMTTRTYHSTVMNLTELPPDFEISVWILVAARPPPAPPCTFAEPRTTCVTERRPSAIECLAPYAASMCLSLWSETRGAVEPLM